MPFEVRRVVEGTPEYEKALALYDEAFPPEEQYPITTLNELSQRDGVDFLAYYKDGEFCGFTFSVVSGEYFYLLFLAVVGRLRGQGVGAGILSQLRAQYPDKKFVLDIEPLDPAAPNNEQRMRRVHFYERNGYSFTGWEKTTTTMVYVIMCTSDAFEGHAFEEAISSVTPEIMPGEVRLSK